MSDNLTPPWYEDEKDDDTYWDTKTHEKLDERAMEDE